MIIIIKLNTSLYVNNYIARFTQYVKFGIAIF